MGLLLVPGDIPPTAGRFIGRNPLRVGTSSARVSWRFDACRAERRLRDPRRPVRHEFPLPRRH